MNSFNQVYGALKANLADNVIISAIDKSLTGNGTTNDATALNTYITAVGTAQTDLYFPSGTYKIGTNVTIPANMRIIMANGAMFSVDNGVTLTINGEIDAGLYQLFTGAGTVVPSTKNKIYIEWYGAVSDALYLTETEPLLYYADAAHTIRATDNTASIQKCFDSIVGGTVLFSGIYRVASEVYVNNKHINLVGISKYDSRIVSDGTDNILRIHRSGLGGAGERATIRHLCVSGNGVYVTRDKSTTKSGIILDSASNWVLFDVWCTGCGEHGLSLNYPSSLGSWDIDVFNCEFDFNKLDGIYMVSEDSGTQMNAINIHQCNIDNNLRNGITLWGLNINICFNTLQKNEHSGIMISYEYVTELTRTAATINILNNHMELNKDGHINLKTKYAASPLQTNYITGINVEKNYMFLFASHVNSGITAINKITTTGDSVSSPSIKGLVWKDNYVYTDSLKHLDAGNKLSADSLISNYNTGFWSNYINLGYARCITPYQRIPVSGYFKSKGLAWSAIEMSDSFNAPTSITFLLDTIDIAIVGLGIYVDTDYTSYTLNFKLYVRDAKTINTYTNSFNQSLSPTTAGYKSLNFSSYHNPDLTRRIYNGQEDAYIVVTVTPGAGGTYFRLGNLVIEAGK